MVRKNFIVSNTKTEMEMYMNDKYNLSIIVSSQDEDPIMNRYIELDRDDVLAMINELTLIHKAMMPF